jgi:hypothetical protein
MELTKPMFRSTYWGEVVNINIDGSNAVAKARELPAPMTHRAIVLGNGPSRLAPDVAKVLEINGRRPAQGYKMVYACNAAARYENADRFVIKSRLQMGYLPQELFPRLFLPAELWLDYRTTNLIPFVSHFDAGISAAYLACFDGHDEVYLFGFDGDSGVPWHNIYEGEPGYPTQHVPDAKRGPELANLMQVYSNVRFVRVNPQDHTPPEWRACANYHEVPLRQAVTMGDF